MIKIFNKVLVWLALDKITAVEICKNENDCRSLKNIPLTFLRTHALITASHSGYSAD
jgi:hypothetical protein